MKSKDPEPMRDVSGYRTFVETNRSQLVSNVVWGISGIVLGLSLEQLLARKFPAHAPAITSAAVIGLVLIQMCLLTVQFLRLRRWRLDLRAEHLRLVDWYNAKVDEIFSDDPIGAARAKMEMEKRWPRP